MNETKVQEWLALSSDVLRRLEQEFGEAMDKYNLRMNWNPVDATWWLLTGLPESQRLFWQATGEAIRTLRELQPQVPIGGPPHGEPDNWKRVWLDLAESTDEQIRRNVLFVSRNSGFNAGVEAVRGFSFAVKGFVDTGAEAAKGLGMVAVGIAAILLLREFGTRGQKA